MKKYIVSTTINHPTNAIKKFDSMKGWELIVIGDKKTPKDYRLDNGIYFSPDDQEKLGFDISDVIPWNCIQRRNLGFLYALKQGAAVIASVDDDNIPYDDWDMINDSLIDRKVQVNSVISAPLVVDPLYEVNHGCNVQLWHRGFPIQLLNQRKINQLTHKLTHKQKSIVDVGIVAGLWDGEPDVDAIARISAGNMNLSLKPKNANVFGVLCGTFSPFNTQNIVFTRELAPCMGLPISVGRMDDIWASYLTQRVMFELGKNVVYTKPTVYQRRNEHDIIIDLNAEILGYRHSLTLLKNLININVNFGSVIEMYEQVVPALLSINFSGVSDVKRFTDAWIGDVKKII